MVRNSGITQRASEVGRHITRITDVLAYADAATFKGRQDLRLAAADLTVLAQEIEKVRNLALTAALEGALADQALDGEPRDASY